METKLNQSVKELNDLKYALEKEHQLNEAASLEINDSIRKLDEKSSVMENKSIILVSAKNQKDVAENKEVSQPNNIQKPSS